MKKRLQFDFSEDAVKRLKRLTEDTESATNAEVVRRSLKFYEFIIQKMQEGYSVKIEKDDDKIIIPAALL